MTQLSTIPEDHIKVRILEPEKVLYDGFVQALTCHNLDGEFDILPLHGNFVSLVDEYIILHFEDNTQKQIKISKALLKAAYNSITVLLNIDLTERDIIFKALFEQIDSDERALNK